MDLVAPSTAAPSGPGPKPVGEHRVFEPLGPPMAGPADTVTEMALVKHHHQAGVPAQRGIED